VETRLRELETRVGRDRLQAGLACVEFFPYHSTWWAGPPLVPSQQFSFDLVNNALNAGKVIVVLRSWQTWLAHVPALGAYPRLVRHRNPRSSFISPATLGPEGFAMTVQALGDDQAQ
jgi:hypothetical protein